MHGDFFPELVAVHLQGPASPIITVIAPETRGEKGNVILP